MDVSVNFRESHLIGELSAWQHHNKHKVEEEPDGAANVKWKTFTYNNNDEMMPMKGVRSWVMMTMMTARLKKKFVIHAARAHCDWTKYGPCLMEQIND